MTQSPAAPENTETRNPTQSNAAQSATKGAGLLRGTSVVASLTLLSRVLGLVRDLFVARFLGAGLYTDAFFVAFRIPNLMRSLVAEGALTSAFVPVFTDTLHESEESARNTLGSAIKFLLGLTIGISLAGVLLAPTVVALLAPGFSSSPEQFTLCVRLTRTMIFYLIFVSMVALSNGALNSKRIFGAAPLGQISMNLVLIAGAASCAWFGPVASVYVLAGSVLVGGIVQVLVQLPLLKRGNLLPAFSLPLWSSTTQAMVKLMIPATAGAAVYQLSIFVTTILASFLPIGSVSWLFYADRLAQLPIGLFTIALASVLLPSLSSANSSGDESGFNRVLVDSLRFTSFVMIPISALLFVLAEDLTALLFQRGEFTAATTYATAWAVRAMCFGLWGISCTSMAMRSFIARKDTVTPTFVAALNLLTSVVLAVWLIGTPTRGLETSVGSVVNALHQGLATLLPSPALGHVGLALASGLAHLLTLPLVLLLVVKKSPSISFTDFSKSTALSLVGVLAALLASGAITGFTGLPHILLVTFFGAAAYLATTLLLGCREAKETLGVLSKLVRKVRK